MVDNPTPAQGLELWKQAATVAKNSLFLYESTPPSLMRTAQFRTLAYEILDLLKSLIKNAQEPSYFALLIYIESRLIYFDSKAGSQESQDGYHEFAQRTTLILEFIVRILDGTFNDYQKFVNMMNEMK